MRGVAALLALAVFLPYATVDAAAGNLRLVVAAPGFPSNTEEAQPTMDAFARAVERAAGWTTGRLEAVYHPSVEAGLESLADERTALALVPLPFYLRYAGRAALEPLLEVAQTSGADEVWSLVARRASIIGPGDLTGWALSGNPGYAPEFVRRIVLGSWGALPSEVRIEFTPRVLSALRRAAKGEKVAVLLDRAQTAALETLPFAGQLEIVTRSEPMPGILLCRVGDRLPAGEAGEVGRAFLSLEQTDADTGLLETLRIRGFGRLEPGEIEALEGRFRAERTER